MSEDREKRGVSETYEIVGIDIGLDDLFPLTRQTELLRLEHEVGVLSSGHLVIEDTRV